VEIVIDGRSIFAEEDLHKILAQQLDFGPFYGNNLAALEDRLTTDIERPFQIIWESSDVSRRQLGNLLFDKIVSIFKFVEEQDVSFGLKEKFSYSLR
jgi:ribonuclease inhibitor